MKKSWITLSVSFCFMLLIFAPLEAYLTNTTEFWFTFIQLLPIVLVSFAAGFIVLCLFYVVLKRSELFSYIYIVFFGVFIGMYIQGNYIPRDYGVLDGREIQWEQYTGYGIASIVLWSIILFLVMFICIKFRDKFYRVGQTIALIILLVQIITLSVLFIQKPNVERSNMVVTTQDMLTLSENKNIVVFLMDAFDSTVLRELLESEFTEEAEAALVDFTYYPDAVGGYPTTKGSLPFILTGKWYENDIPFSEYVELAYQDNELYSVLQESNYSIGVYTDSMYMSSDINLYSNAIEGNYQISDKLKFAQKLYELVAFKYMPHQVKKNFVVYSGDFSAYKKLDGEYEVYSESLTWFYNKLLDEKITFSEPRNAFRFYHLTGTHSPYTFDINLKEDNSKKYTVQDEARGNLKLIKQFCDYLKEAGVYDDTTIIVMADHGADSANWGNSINQNPVFLIKEFNTMHEFNISDSPISWEDVSPTIQSLASGKKIAGNIWQYSEETVRTRRFLHYSWDNSWDVEYLPTIAEYSINGKAYEMDSLLPTGRIYASSEDAIEEGFVFEGDINIVIDDENPGYNALVRNGFGNVELTASGNSYVWTMGRYSHFMVGFDDDYSQDFRMTLGIGATVGDSEQEIVAIANGKVLKNVNIKSNKIVIEVPNECIENNMLNLIIYYPNAYSPADLGIGRDARLLAFMVNNVYLEECDIKEFVFDDRIEIPIDDNNEDYQNLILSGVYNVETVREGAYAAWTEGSETNFLVRFDPEYKEDFRIILKIGASIDENQIAIAYANDIELDTVEYEDDKIIIEVPNECIKDNYLALKLCYPNAFSPSEKGIGSDKRTLAYLIRGIICEKCIMDEI